MVAACGEFRRWALGRRRVRLALRGPLPGRDDEGLGVARQCALEFAGTFCSLFMELWKAIRKSARSSAPDSGAYANMAGRRA
jgi:hypothetical protein